MPDSSSYQEAAEAYASGVRAFLVTQAPPTIERTYQAMAPVTSLTEQAEKLLPVSAGFTVAVAWGLRSPHATERETASTRLLAKAALDLEISNRLRMAAQQDDGNAPAGVERGLQAPIPEAELEGVLDLLSDRENAQAPAALRALKSLPADLPAAHTQLQATIKNTLSQIRDQAAGTGQAALSGLLMLGIGEIAQAAGIVGMDVAEVLGKGEQVARLYDLCREFGLNAYNSLVALLGPELAQTAAQQAVAWANDVAGGQGFGQLLEKLYQTAQIESELAELTAKSQAGLDNFVAALQAVDGLNDTYQQQIGIVDKVLRGLRLFSGVPLAVLPQGKLLLGAAFLVVGAYVVFAGADYVDARWVKLLNRVPGVRQVVVKNLQVKITP